MIAILNSYKYRYINTTRIETGILGWNQEKNFNEHTMRATARGREIPLALQQNLHIMGSSSNSYTCIVKIQSQGQLHRNHNQLTNPLSRERQHEQRGFQHRIQIGQG